MSKPMNTSIVLRSVTQADVDLLDHWDRQPQVISATTDDPAATKAFQDVYWPDEFAAQDEYNQYLIAELDGRPIGAMQMIDPHLERTHYWGEIPSNLRALDIWIGEPDCLGKGYGETMMRLAFQRCFADPAVTAIVIDPLVSNARAHKFYQRIGFKPVGQRKFGDDDCLVHELSRADWRARFAEDAAV
jgi:aminoglycoside 6'-N-acetyltransferase